tara:strand:- start:479 stop:1936 length:1458 start_codon:yes stop_codon:yes gene_type:complete
MNRKFLLLSISLGLSIAAICLVIGCLYVFSSPNARLRFDLTAEKSNGVSERMLNAIASIDAPVRLTAFLYREDEKLNSYNSNVYMRAFDRLRLLIDDLEARASGSFSSLIIDSNSPLVEQQRLQQLHSRQSGEVIILSTSDNHVVLKFEDLFEVSQAVDEQRIAARLRRERIDEAIGDAALRLSNANPFKVAVIKALADDVSIQPFLEFLERQGHTVSHVNSFSMVDNQDLVVVPGQLTPFTPLDFAAAKQWVDDDRHLFLALGAFTNTAVVDQWNQILAERGEHFEEGLLCEAIPIAGTFMEGRHECAILEINAGKISGQHKINEPLLKTKRSLLFAGTRPLTFGDSTNKYSQSRLLRTSVGAWIDNDKQGVRFARDGNEKAGIHAIAIASAVWSPQSALRAGHLLLSGSDEIMREHLDYNKDWLATSIMFLLGDDLEKSGLRSINEIPFHPSREILGRIKSLTLYLLPGLCLLLSLIVWMRRK